MERRKTLVAASVAGLLAALGSGVLGPGLASAQEAEKAACYGINKCKGTGDCGGKGHSCAGQNECAGQAFIKLEKEDCLRIEGGSLTPLAQ
jgi:uncharacterized membrane protein